MWAAAVAHGEHVRGPSCDSCGHSDISDLRIAY